MTVNIEDLKVEVVPEPAERDPNILYVDLVRGFFQPTEQIKKALYFSHGGARYSEEAVLNLYRKRLQEKFSSERGRQFLRKLGEHKTLHLVSHKGLPTVYTKIFAEVLFQQVKETSP